MQNQKGEKGSMNRDIQSNKSMQKHTVQLVISQYLHFVSFGFWLMICALNLYVVIDELKVYSIAVSEIHIWHSCIVIEWLRHCCPWVTPISDRARDLWNEKSIYVERNIFMLRMQHHTLNCFTTKWYFYLTQPGSLNPVSMIYKTESSLNCYCTSKKCSKVHNLISLTLIFVSNII